jgi:hypothetical protein
VVSISEPATATQKLVVGHAPEANGGVLALALQALAPPVGSVELRTVLALSTTKQIGCVEQKIELIERSSSILATDHVPVGLVEVRTLPSPFVATHRLTDGQLTSFTYVSVPGSGVDVHPDMPAVGLLVVSMLFALGPTHSVLDGQLMVSGTGPGGKVVSVQDCVPPEGSVEPKA